MMSKQTLSIKEFYDKYAEKYNEKRVLKGGTLFNEFIEIPSTKSLLRGHRLKNKTVLDIGCGVGAYSNYFSSTGGIVTAIDVSAEMLEIAKQNCVFSDSIQFIKGDFQEYDFKNNRYDFIIGGFMLSYFFDLRKSLRKLSMLLNENGVAILSMLHPVKLSLISKSEDSFCMNNYFDENDYRTDLSFNMDEIELKKWNLEDIFKAAKESDLYVDDLQEPRPSSAVDKRYSEFVFYHKCPSVIVFKFKKRVI